MNTNLLYTQQPPEYNRFTSPQQSAGSAFLLPTGQMAGTAGIGSTNLLPGLCMPSSPQQPQQNKRPTPETSTGSSSGLFVGTPAETNDKGQAANSLTGAIHEFSNSIWAPQEPTSSLTTSFPSVNSANSVNYPSLGINYMIPPNSAPVPAQETSNQTFLYPVSMKSEENGQTLMFFPPRNKDGPDQVNPAYYVLVNNPQSPGPLQYTASTLQPSPSNHIIVGPTSSSVPKNSSDASQPPSPYQMSTGQQQSVPNNFGIPWLPQFTSNMAPTTAGVYPRVIENPKPPQMENTAIPAHGQQRTYYTNTVYSQTVNSAPSPNMNGHRRSTHNGSARVENNGAVQSRGNRNSGNGINGISSTGSGSQEMERRGGLPFEEDPTPIDTTKTQLIVNFLPQFLTDEGFRDLFTPFGEIHTKPTKIIYDRGARRGKGYGFVYYKDGRSTEAAIKTINGLTLGGRRLKVRYADQQRSRVDCDSCRGDDEEESSEDTDVLYENVGTQEKNITGSDSALPWREWVRTPETSLGSA